MLENRWAVVGFTTEKAARIMDEIESACGKEIADKRRPKNSRGLFTRFTDGTVLRCVPANDPARGFRFGKMWCDQNISKEVFECVVMPCYFGKLEDITWI